MIDTAAALRRFGLGPRPGDLARVADARAALLAEVETGGIATAGFETMRGTPQIFMDIAASEAAERALTQERGQLVQRLMAEAAARGQPLTEAQAQRLALVQAVAPAVVNAQLVYFEEMAARAARSAAVGVGFVERLVAFWTNHFAIEARAGQVERSLAGAFEREAIRPFVLGRFRDMLGAATAHPAMLQYLDNAQSIGPDSVTGRATGRGLNENHARELLELHTIGVDAGYTQDDVIALAKILTGWSYQGRNAAGSVGEFIYRAASHEPGVHTVMGVAYPATGQRQGEAVLDFLAAQPATAQHIAAKLVCHFVPDEPPALVEELAAVYRATGGDLAAMARALVASDAAWTDATRLSSPQEYLWSAVRALGVVPEPRAIAQALRGLGQGLWEPPSPEGFGDAQEEWLAPDALTNRLDLAENLALMATPTLGPVQLADAVLGPGMSAATLVAITRAESVTQALALLLMSPEFQRR